MEMEIREKKLSLERFIEYAARFPSVSTRKRIGFILEKGGVETRLLIPLRNSIEGKALIALFPRKSREGPINKDWRIIINDPQG